MAIAVSPNARHIPIITVPGIHLTIATALCGIQHVRDPHHSQIVFVLGRRAASKKETVRYGRETARERGRALTHRLCKCPDKPHHSQHRVWRTRHASDPAANDTGPSSSAARAATGVLWSVRRFPGGWATVQGSQKDKERKRQQETN